MAPMAPIDDTALAIPCLVLLQIGLGSIQPGGTAIERVTSLYIDLTQVGMEETSP